jgi:hypothetical protein
VIGRFQPIWIIFADFAILGLLVRGMDQVLFSLEGYVEIGYLALPFCDFFAGLICLFSQI